MKKIFLLTGLLFIPFPIFAATTLQQGITTLGELIATLTPIVLALALLVFFWGLVRFIYHAGNDEKRKEGKNIMVWGVIALFVMFSIWGLVRVLQQTFLGTASPVNIIPPSIPKGGGNLPSLIEI